MKLKLATVMSCAIAGVLCAGLYSVDPEIDPAFVDTELRVYHVRENEPIEAVIWLFL